MRPACKHLHALVPLLIAGATASAGAQVDARYWLRLSDLHVPRPAEQPQRPRPPAPTQPAPTPAAPAPSSEPTALPAPAQAGLEPSPIEFAGSYRGLVIDGRTPRPGRERYTQVVNRLRLKLGYRPAPSWLIKLEHDTELTTGSYLRTRHVRSGGHRTPRQYFSSGSTWLRHTDLQATQGVFRGFVQYAGDATTVIAGRQRVPLGTGRFWSTLDMLNPINPLQVERDEFVGVDAVFAERSLGELSRLSLTYAPDPRRRHDRWVVQYRTHHDGSDLTLTYGRYWRDDVFGLDLATQYADVALRAEAAYARPGGQGRPYGKVLLGADYVFPNTLSVSGELYWSGQSLQQRLRQWQANPQLAQVQPLGGAYAGISVGYDITPLFKASAYVLANLDDDSRMLYPALSYAITDNAVLSAGAQWFHGGADTEYGRVGRLVFMRFQQFF